MWKIIVGLLWVAALGGACLGFRWTDSLQLACVGVLMVLPTFIGVWHLRNVRRRAAEEIVDEAEEPPLARTLMIQVVLCATCVGYLALGMELIHHAGFGINVLDSDRVSFEEKMALLDNAGNGDRAAELIQERLAQPISEGWSRVLAERQYQYLLKSGQARADLDGRRAKFRIALEVARTYGLDETSALSLDAECEREQRFLAKLDELRASNSWKARAVLLEGSMLDANGFRKRLPLARWLRDTLESWADEVSDTAQKRIAYERAQEICRQHDLDANGLVLKLKSLADAEREKLRPLALLHGSKGVIVNVVRDFSPGMVVADFGIDCPRGTSIAGIGAKDIKLYWNHESVLNFTLTEHRRDSASLAVSIVVDVSGSMTPAMRQAQAGGQAFVRGLVPLKKHYRNIAVEVVTFNHDVNCRCSWTTDVDKAHAALDGLRADGGTALYRAIDASLNSLRDMPGKKHLLVFTDGKDSEGGPTVTELTQRAKTENVVISAIGLKTSDLDSKSLQRLAAETNGNYWEAAGPDRLLEQFRQAGLELRPHFYRLVFTPPEGKAGPLEIRIGGENSLLLSAN